MQPEPYLKCPCENCGANIEFPATGLGQSIPCPHCGQNTRLLESDEPDVESPTISGSKKRRPALFIALSCLALIAAMGFGLFAARKNAEPVQVEKLIPEIKNEEVPPQNPPAKKRSARRAKKTIASPEFEWNGLQALRVSLEKSKNSRLVYATGTIQNKTDRQRFGVKVELDLFDGQNHKLGSATDYVPIIEPHKEWKFRALVAEPEAVSAKVNSITEN